MHEQASPSTFQQLPLQHIILNRVHRSLKPPTWMCSKAVGGGGFQLRIHWLVGSGPASASSPCPLPGTLSWAGDTERDVIFRLEVQGRSSTAVSVDVAAWSLASNQISDASA